MVRAMIVLLVLGSGFLGWNYMRQAKLLERYESELKPKGDIEKKVEFTQKQAHDYAFYLKLAEDSKLDAEGDKGVVLRVREVAQSDSVKWGGLIAGKMNPRRRRVGKEEYVDETTTIRHEDNKHTVSRQRIAHLFYLLEGLRNLHVTRIDISQLKNPKPGDIPDDSWKCSFDVVERKPKEKKK